MIGLITVVLKKITLEDLRSNSKNLYIIREDIINEMFNKGDKKLDIATADDERKK